MITNPKFSETIVNGIYGPVELDNCDCEEAIESTLANAVAVVSNNQLRQIKRHHTDGFIEFGDKTIGLNESKSRKTGSKKHTNRMKCIMQSWAGEQRALREEGKKLTDSTVEVYFVQSPQALSYVHISKCRSTRKMFMDLYNKYIDKVPPSGLFNKSFENRDEFKEFAELNTIKCRTFDPKDVTYEYFLKEALSGK